jgi:hypothetical protein
MRCPARKWWLRILLGLTGALACSSDRSATGRASPVQSVTVMPGVDSALVGGSLQLRAIAVGIHGDTLISPSVTWSSTDTTLAAVTVSGGVTARAAGTLAVEARVQDKTGLSYITVQLPAARIVLPDTVTIYRGSSNNVLVARVIGSRGQELSPRPLSWTSSDTAVVGVFSSPSLPPTGIALVAKANGTATVSATVGKLSASTRVTVTGAPPGRVQILAGPPYDFGADVGDSTLIQAAVLDSTGEPTATPPLTWTTGDPSIVVVHGQGPAAHSAYMRGVRPGRTTMTATSASHATSTVSIIAHFRPVLVRVHPDNLELLPGQYAHVVLTWEDSLGHSVDSDPLVAQISSASAAIATAGAVQYANGCSLDGNSGGWCAQVFGVTPGQTTLNVSAVTPGGATHTASVAVHVVPNSAGKFYWGPATVLAVRGTTVVGSYAYVDSAGNPLTQPQTIAFVSRDTLVATVSPAQATGVTSTGSVSVSGKSPGHTQIVMTSGSHTAALDVTVTDIGVASVSIAPKPAVLQVGDGVQLTATVRDSAGTPFALPVVWSTSDASVATVSAAGTLAAVGGGRTVVRATYLRAAIPVADSLALIVTSLAAPVVASMEPTTMVAGGTVTFTGSNFGNAVGSVQLTVDGVPVTPTSVSPTSLTVVLPSSASFPCTPTHLASVVIRVGAELGVSSQSLSVAAQQALAIGQSLSLLTTGAVRCNEFTTAGAQYAIAVVNGDPSAERATGFELDGTAGSTSVASQSRPTTGPIERMARRPVVPIAIQSRRIAHASIDQILQAAKIDPGALAARAALHGQVLDRNRQWFRRLGPPSPLLDAARGRSTGAAARAPIGARDVIANPDSTYRLKIPNLADPLFCGDYTPVTARRAFVGPHIEILEDVTSPLAGQMDESYARLGEEVERVDWPELTTNFGDPLAMAAQLDSSHRVTMLFSPAVNAYGIGGFVVGCDFYPESVAPSSNMREMLYADAPVTDATTVPADAIAAWRRVIRGIIAHELKHVTAYAVRLSVGAPPEESWLEESTAMVSEELYDRSITGAAWRGDAKYRATLYCEVRPNVCPDVPYVMFQHFLYLYEQDLHIEGLSPLGPAPNSPPTFYGGGWSFVRWAIDQYASSEPTFLRALVADPIHTGLANLQARTGRSFDEMLSDWSLASYLDDSPASSFRLSLPSWNTRDVFAGMNADFPDNFFAAFPIAAHELPAGDFATSIATLIGGGASIFDLTSPSTGTQLLELQTVGGGPPPPTLRMEVVRVR